TASVRASAARSASLKYGASRHAATVKRRSSVSPACLISRACMSTHTPQPLIWLARNSTSPSVAFGTPLFPTADDNSWSAFMASGRIIAGLFILDCIIVSPPLFTLLCLPWLVYLRKQLNLIHQYSDESPGRNVTGRLLSHFRLRY